MWHEIRDNQDAKTLMAAVGGFHDSCVKEIHYISGACVLGDLGMWPLNSRRSLRVLIQRQFEENSVVELEFLGLKYLHLRPVTEDYTCELLDATLVWKNGDIYWCDCGVPEEKLTDYDGTLICAAGLRWRPIDHGLGQEDFYTAREPENA